jgi:hypothetical protein
VAVRFGQSPADDVQSVQRPLGAANGEASYHALKHGRGVVDVSAGANHCVRRNTRRLGCAIAARGPASDSDSGSSI